ncbi:MAG: UMP kinase [Candidatus Paceibacterota bacterium]|jgi:uridylate kinase
MNHPFGKVIIVSLGGSIVCPDGVDVPFLKKFKKLVEAQIKKGTKFVLIIGGGRISRDYQNAAGAVSSVVDEDKDWIGIHATRLNAHLLRTIFRNMCDPTIIDSREKVKKLKYPITIGAGWRPGWSTDFVTVATAADLKIKEVIFAGKPEYVYNKDNQKFKDAMPFEKMSWPEYKKLIPAKWSPGFHSPVDPVAARLAEKAKITGIVIGGRDLKNFSNLITGKNFKGTTIS